MISALSTLGSTVPQQIQKFSPKHQLRNRILIQSAKHLDSNLNFGTKRSLLNYTNILFLH